MLAHLGDADPSSAQEDHRRPILLVNLAELQPGRAVREVHAEAGIFSRRQKR